MCASVYTASCAGSDSDLDGGEKKGPCEPECTTLYVRAARFPEKQREQVRAAGADTGNHGLTAHYQEEGGISTDHAMERLGGHPSCPLFAGQGADAQRGRPLLSSSVTTDWVR